MGDPLAHLVCDIDADSQCLRFGCTHPHVDGVCDSDDYQRAVAQRACSDRNRRRHANGQLELVA